jgi:RNA polymerase sigma factor (sigma-70 family)
MLAALAQRECREPESFTPQPEIYQVGAIQLRGASVAGTDEGRDQRELRFHRLYQAYFRPVQAYTVNRLGPVDEAADIVAEVFLTAWRRLPDIPPPPGDRFWLYGTARGVISRRHRSASRLNNLVSRLAAVQRQAGQRQQEQSLAWAQDPAQERLLAAVARLKPADREALLLVHWEQLTYAEAAETLGCSVNAIGIRVHKAKARLRELLATDTQAGPAPARHQAERSQ